MVEHDPYPLQSDPPVILLGEGDLLTQDAAAPYDRFSPCSEFMLRS
jgi:hypothetical protein